MQNGMPQIMNNTITNKKIYFASDLHLGIPSYQESKEREILFVKWLDKVKKDTDAIFLLGDLFDFWFEYKTVVPKGFTRFFGKLTEIVDSGIPIYFFTGNHDLWIRNYFEEELGFTVFKEPQTFQINGKKFFIGHGDGLGSFDKKYKITKQVFINPFCKWLFRQLHPDFSTGIARWFSNRSKKNNKNPENKFLGADGEWLALYAKEMLKTEHYDYFIFGHRHLPIEISLGNNSTYFNTGEWITQFSYLVLDGEKVNLHYF